MEWARIVDNGDALLAASDINGAAAAYQQALATVPPLIPESFGGILQHAVVSHRVALTEQLAGNTVAAFDRYAEVDSLFEVAKQISAPDESAYVSAVHDASLGSENSSRRPYRMTCTRWSINC